MKQLMFWTAVCTVPVSVITVMAFKLAGVHPGGWSGGIGAGIGVVCGALVAAKRSKAEDEGGE